MTDTVPCWFGATSENVATVEKWLPPNPKSISAVTAFTLPKHVSDMSYQWLDRSMDSQRRRAHPIEEHVSNLGGPFSSPNEVAQFACSRLLDGKPGSRTCTLAGDHFVIPRAHGFESWPEFAKQLSALAQKNSLVARFEAAADAIARR
jgi:hypothetical protein